VSGMAGDGGPVFYVVLFAVALLTAMVAALAGRALWRLAAGFWNRLHRPDPEAERMDRIELCLTRLELSGVDVSQLLGEWLPVRPR
jgi:hypothetical protein